MKIHKGRWLGKLTAVALATVMVFGSAISQTMANDVSFGNVITASAEDTILEGTYCTFNQDTGLLTILAEKTKNIIDNKGNIGLKLVFDKDELTKGLPSNFNKNSVKSVIAENGVIFFSKMYYAFKNFTNVETIDLSGADMSTVQEFREAFYSCKKLESVKFPEAVGSDSRKVNYTFKMFLDYIKLEKLDLSSFTFDQSGLVENMNDNSSNTKNYKMFSGMSTLKELIFPESLVGFDIQTCTLKNVISNYGLPDKSKLRLENNEK